MADTLQRIRQPKAPPIKNLETCVEYVKILYDIFSHGSFSRSEIANALKLTANSGFFNQVLSSLRSFGLIEASHDGYKVTELFKQIKSSNREEGVFKLNALNAIRTYPIFDEILSEFKYKIPNHYTITQRLEISKKFKLASAKLTSKIFHESLSFANVVDANGNLLPVRNDVLQMKETLSKKDEVVTGDEILSDSENSSKSLILQIPLNNDRIAKIIYPNDISETEIEKLSKVLAAIAS